MKPFKDMTFHPVSEQVVEMLCERTRRTEPLFFRIMVAYYFSVVASMMRCSVKSPDGAKLPINLYTINLAPSGFGKGLSMNLLEQEVVNEFLTRFKEETFQWAADQRIPVLSHERALRTSSDPDDELVRVEKEFEALGPYEISFNSATESAIKQLRHKLLMADAGAINLQIDEIGSNLTGNLEALNAFLELYDLGRIKNSLRKNTAENKRFEAIDGQTPTNMLLFGTPTKLLNGSKVEEEFYSMLDTGYARRCFFGLAKGLSQSKQPTAKEVLAQRMNAQTTQFMSDLSDRIGLLADPVNLQAVLPIPEEVELIFIEYQLHCEREANALPEHEEMRKAEQSHRHFKAKKLAGAYAFIDGSPEVTEDHAYFAIKLAEESGQAFANLLTRDRPYVKLAKYIASINRSVTEADLVEDLPFYKGSASQKSDMMQLAIAYGYQNNILIKQSFNDGIKFLRGETLKQTDLTKIPVSYSTDIATGYANELAPFDQLHKLTQTAGLHWVNHHLKDGHRHEESIEAGFNVVVLDVDNGTSLEVAQKLLADYKALFYTTKRHTPQAHRFRIILPTNYELSLDAKDYKEFMQNLFEWLPFEVDTATGQRARKWLSHNGQHFYQDGELLDVLPFIPKTSKNEAFKESLTDLQQLDNLERWFIRNTGDGNRNNQILRYALILVDAGFDYEPIRQKVNALNEKLSEPIPEQELLGTVMVTATKAIAKRNP